MSFFGKLFGTEKALDSVVKAASSGLDYLVHTDQEKAEEAAADRSEARKMVVKWMESTQGQNLARRALALSITCTWLLQYILSMTLGMVAIWISDPDINARMIATTAVVENAAQQMNGAVMLILAFYFAAPHMSSIVGAALGKFGKNKPTG